MDLAGCVPLKPDESVVKELLEAKYNKEFEVENIQSYHSFDGYFTAIAYPSDNPNLLFSVNVDNSGESESDDYVSKLLSMQLAERISYNLDPLNGFYYVHAAQFVSDTSLTDPDLSVDDYLRASEQPRDFNIYLCYCPDNDELSVDPDNFYSGLHQMFRGLESMNGMIYLYVCDEKSLQNMQLYFETHDKLYNDFNVWADAFYKGNIRCVGGAVALEKDDVLDFLRGEY